MFQFLTIVQALVAAALVAVILMQQSEGGGLGTGGSPSGVMSARGAANIMTRLTSILAGVFVLLSIVLASLAVGASSGRQIDTSLQRNIQQQAPASTAPAAPAPAPAATGAAADPLSGAAKQ
ncbi:preprotein translocase subunit SecG [Novosphingobium sp. 9]|uniref:preprotein translocase subunit SecG n=1 Tax=Novosphingobium sp. 9 TaxID=2025349 RepID=UPI0021B5A6D0|nr:preprotein translocase subunit SecG [Novosphingobium sp. 9]